MHRAVNLDGRERCFSYDVVFFGETDSDVCVVLEAVPDLELLNWVSIAVDCPIGTGIA